MASIAEQWLSLWEWIKGTPARVVRSTEIPVERVQGGGETVDRFTPGAYYFAVYINELFLTHARQWTSTFDPMALVVTEFTYAGKPTTVPFVVGPSLLAGKVEQIPEGMVFTDTQVAGIHPYPGGKFALTVILAQVKRQSYPQKLLKVIEQIAGSFPVGAALESHLKVAETIFDGVEALFSLGDTRPLAGHRWEFNPGFTPWMKPGFFVLVDADEGDVGVNHFHVVNGRLCTGDNSATAPFRRADYLLYSLRTATERTDVGELPFYELFDKALKAAGSTESGSWERAKAILVTLYQEMITSPDLTWDQAQRLVDHYTGRLLEARRRVESFGTLGPEDHGATISRVAEVFGADPNARDRAQRLLEIHTLLRLGEEEGNGAKLTL